jgi:uncharacterized membrane protein YcaP (DUF421 family)
VFDVDWGNLLLPHVPFAETFVRGTVVFLVLFAILRFLPNRMTGSLGVNDLLLLILLATAAQNAISGRYDSLGDGMLLVAVVTGWSLVIGLGAQRVPLIQRFARPRPRLLVRRGRLLRDNLDRELITIEELMSQLRLEGIRRLDEIDRAFLEPDGQVSVIRRDGAIAAPKALDPERAPDEEEADELEKSAAIDAVATGIAEAEAVDAETALREIEEG